MKTITIYELMGLIKEDKAPEYIKIGHIKYKKCVGAIDYFDNYGNRLSDMIDFSVLNDEVEIIEQDKELKKINSLNNVENSQDIGEFADKQQLNNHILKNKINELIDIINEMKEDKEQKKIPEKLEYVVSDENGEFSINGFTFDYEQKMQIIDTINQVIDCLKSKGE